MSAIHALAATQAKGKLEPFSYDPGPLGDEEVEIAVEYCGICHSDLSIINNEFGITQYPLVPGHEAIGKVVALGPDAKLVKEGQTVGLGWYAESCLYCQHCVAGDHNLCVRGKPTIIGHHGAFATRVRCHWIWATPIQEGIDPAKAGPLLCAGSTVFNPLVQFDIRPTDRVGIIGIGGLGHLALQFANKWGCEVTAFTSSSSKADEVKKLGAHKVLDTNSKDELKKAAGSFDFILSTIMAKIELGGYLNALAPRGRFHTVGFTPELRTSPAPLIMGQKEISGSPVGAPRTAMAMLDFCARHKIEAITEEFPMSQANEAIAHLEAGKARYRIVLKNDLH